MTTQKQQLNEEDLKWCLDRHYKTREEFDKRPKLWLTEVELAVLNKEIIDCERDIKGFQNHLARLKFRRDHVETVVNKDGIPVKVSKLDINKKANISLVDNYINKNSITF